MTQHPKKKEEMDSLQKALLVVDIALTKKALNPKVICVGELTSFTSYFVICEGDSSRQIKAIVDEIFIQFKKKKVHPLGIEGKGGSEWVLMDYNDVIVHVFTPETRQYYNLEGLWCDAEIIEVANK